MNINDKQLNKRIMILACTVVTIATIAMILQFKVLYEIGVASASQVFVVSATVVMQMAALLVISLYKTKTHLAEVRNLAYIDELTGLINRRKFNDVLERTIRDNKSANKKTGILILDLDRFKAINDRYGHDAGDKVIVQFGERIKSTVSESSTICRMAGDEFALMLHDIKDKNDILDVSDLILKEMKKPFIYEGKKIQASVSIGAAIIDGNEDENMLPLRMADYALLISKEQGRNRVMLFNPAMAKEIKRRKHLETSLSSAISNEALSLNYQPFVLQESSSISGVEAFVRWNDPVEGEILPAEFMPVAQQLGLLEEIGEFILERACREIKPLKGIHLAINVNAAQFKNTGFVEQLKRVLEKTGFEPQRLELELCQNLLVSSSKRIKSDLDTIRELGVSVVLDDFGTSYSSMFYLRDFKLDRVKLDRNFVTNMNKEPDGDEIIDNMIGLGSTFSDKLTVEGIETQEQLNSIQDKGANYLQGFLFSKPLTIEQLKNCEMITDLADNSVTEGDLVPINRIAS